MNPTYPLAAFLKKIVNDWHCHVSVYAIARAKKKSLGNINEDQELAGGMKRFKRMYICLGPLKMGFINGCRPLFGLDGCHLKDPYGGYFLAAVATDANDNNRYTLFNDWLVLWQGLINALEAVFPNAEHRLCVMHLYRNMWKEHKGIDLSRKCFEWLSEKPRSQWSRSAFRNLCRSYMFVNNHCEVFNNTIRKYMDLPIISMLKAIHTDVMVRIQKRRDKVLNNYAFNPVCSNAMRRLNKAIDHSKDCHVIWSGGARYLVIMSTGGYEMVVNLEAHTCACKKWDLSCIPCYHACACTSWIKKPYEPFIYMSYNKNMFLKCYSNIVEPIVGDSEWTKTPYPSPCPQKKVQLGTPKKKMSKVNDIADPSRIKIKR
ncbi:uncharacterized protein LOC141674263 [Apium graveolens]|uniref:uncharacterized protein LOC141674263 n=1 Tax=Apium graveolens TaxID=4045 RepID=UPI003D7B6F35